MTMYLNRYDFLNQAVGIRSASNIYFNKEVVDLKVEECAMLVGMLKNSALFNPLRRMEMVTTRRNVVLNQMQKYGYLEESVADSSQGIDHYLELSESKSQRRCCSVFSGEITFEVKECFL